LKETGFIDFSGRALFKFPLMTLCKTPQKRTEINNQTFEHYISTIDEKTNM